MSLVGSMMPRGGWTLVACKALIPPREFGPKLEGGAVMIIRQCCKSWKFDQLSVKYELSRSHKESRAYVRPQLSFYVLMTSPDRNLRSITNLAVLTKSPRHTFDHNLVSMFPYESGSKSKVKYELSRSHKESRAYVRPQLSFYVLMTSPDRNLRSITNLAVLTKSPRHTFDHNLVSMFPYESGSKSKVKYELSRSHKESRAYVRPQLSFHVLMTSPDRNLRTVNLRGFSGVLALSKGSSTTTSFVGSGTTTSCRTLWSFQYLSFFLPLVLSPLDFPTLWHEGRSPTLTLLPIFDVVVLRCSESITIKSFKYVINIRISISDTLLIYDVSVLPCSGPTATSTDLQGCHSPMFGSYGD
ncbi:hypothetical protein COLO4_05084 [Corchorus olitorius]|uniref:Uncharacterized protein n=1 Tax=Corchorus olitorius TaxID=93759 RepID=A0A1R3KS01_9ROSI|nr:hypothetical protein COLO4_05084 [Corchorus olitorius]